MRSSVITWLDDSKRASIFVSFGVHCFVWSQQSHVTYKLCTEVIFNPYSG